jgi:hypothetical protein
VHPGEVRLAWMPGTTKRTSMSEANLPKERKPALKRLLHYNWIVKNIPYFLFLSALAVIYIYNGHYSDKTIKDINKTGKELRELQYEYKSLKSEVMFRSKQSELAKAVEPLGLKELSQPPMVLKDSTGNR